MGILSLGGKRIYVSELIKVSARDFRIGILELFPFQFSMHPISGPGSFWLFVSGMVTTQHYLETLFGFNKTHMCINLGFFPGISSCKRQKVNVDEISVVVCRLFYSSSIVQASKRCLFLV